MKKFLLLSFTLFLIAYYTKATIHTVAVTSNQFNPANIPDVFVNDTIRYQFQQGFHNATSNGVTNAIPAGADPINSGAPSGANPRTYDYKVTKVGSYKYVCEVHYDFSTAVGMQGTFIASAPLPVVLKHFTMGASNSKPVFNWSTLQEENISHFSIRRSVDGSNYSEAGKVMAAGTSQNEQSYTFTDNHISVKYKYLYYLLVIVHKDGREVFSETRLFKNNAAIPKLVLTLSPNPLTSAGHLMMTFNSEKEGKMEVRVINAEGRRVLNLSMQAFVGVNNGHVHFGNLPSGTYSLICIMNGIKETYKVIYKR